MALLTKGHINQFGVDENYWRIINININLQYNYCDITVAGYATQEARDNGSEPMNIKKVRAKWSEDEFEAFFAPKTVSRAANQNIYNIAYEYIKSKDDLFKDSVNI